MRSTYRSSTRRHGGWVPRRRPEATARTSVSSSRIAARIRASARSKGSLIFGVPAAVRAQRAASWGESSRTTEAITTIRSRPPSASGITSRRCRGFTPPSLERVIRGPRGARAQRAASWGESAGSAARAARTTSSTERVPSSISASGTQATASVVPSTSATRGSASAATVARKSRWTPWKSSKRPDGATPPKCRSWTSSRSPTWQSTPHSSRTSRASPSRGDSPWSRPPPGRVQEPEWKPRSEIRVSSTSSPRRISA